MTDLKSLYFGTTVTVKSDRFDPNCTAMIESEPVKVLGTFGKKVRYYVMLRREDDTVVERQSLYSDEIGEVIEEVHFDGTDKAVQRLRVWKAEVKS